MLLTKVWYICKDCKTPFFSMQYDPERFATTDTCTECVRKKIELTPKQMTEVVAEIQRILLKHARTHNTTTVAFKIQKIDDGDLTCCGSAMVYAEFLGIRRYRCTYRPGHPARYIRISDGEMVREENLDLG